ncbi:unnamed protein product, partial [Effrenium voratum]
AQLGPAARAAFARLEAQSSSLASQAEQNINEDCSFVDLAPEDLEGCSESFVQSLPTEAGLKRCSLKAPVLAPIMQRAVRSETRRRMMEASQQRCMDTNGPILEELVTARHNAAVQLGFKSHAERVLSAKMAATPAAVESFCREMLQRMRAARDQDLRRLAQRKQKDSEPGQKRKAEGELHAWDVSYYSDLLKREELSLDDEKLKEFFPLEGTIQRMLQVYSELLGLGFERSELPTWHQEVLAFEVKDGSKVVGHLYLDQFPRDGKFSHQMIVPLSPAFVSENGEECLPACVNISNLSRPEGALPALLRFAEMKTLFHELGHVVHCLCTQSRFSLLSWAWPMVPWPGGVEQDFLEVPSMALEKFACEPQLLQRVASHFEDPKAQLEESTIQTIKDLERWMVGIQESRYFAMSLFDLMVHSQAPPYSLDGEEGLSLAELFRRVMQQQTCLQQLPDTNFSCSWYHLYIGYDAGFYGYGWSDVFAADIFETMRASKEGALSGATGQALRSEILAPCATRCGQEMLRRFLGREPSVEARSVRWPRFGGVLVSWEEILHGLLVTKPADPHGFVEAHLAKARKLAALSVASPYGPAPSRILDAAQSETDRGSVGSGQAAELYKAQPVECKEEALQRAALGQRVEALLMTLEAASNNLELARVLHLVPDTLRESISDPTFVDLPRTEEPCVQKFKSLDKEVELSRTQEESIAAEQCRKFADMFDSDQDGLINVTEFTQMVQFVTVAGWLETQASLADKTFQDFIHMIEVDKERLWSIIPFLPDWLAGSPGLCVQHLTGKKFEDAGTSAILPACHEQFDALDADRSGELEPMELLPVIQGICQTEDRPKFDGKLMRFTSLFDTDGNGVIRRAESVGLRDEFIEFAQFLTVMNFLTNTEEGLTVEPPDHRNRALRAMKCMSAVLLLALANAAQAASVIAKVISMLESMKESGLKEKQQEEVQYAAYHSWCDAEIATKTREVGEGGEKVQLLQAGIESSLSAAETLAAQLAEKAAELEKLGAQKKNASATRSSQAESYKTTHKDYTESIQAIMGALRELKTKASADVGSFLATKASRAAFLALVRRGSEPEKSLDSLDFSSSRIEEMLTALKDKFREERAAAEKEELQLGHAHEKLLQELTLMISQGESDQSAKSQSKAKAQEAAGAQKAELADSESSVEELQKYLQEVKVTCEQKAKDYEERMKLRDGETMAITKATELLSSQQVGATQGRLSLQQRRTALVARRSHSASATDDEAQRRAAQYLQSQAVKFNSRVLSSIATRLSADPMAKVRDMVKSLITKLQEESSEEMEHRQWCEKELGENKRARESRGSSVESLQAEVETTGSEVAKLAVEIQELASQLAENKETLANQTETRKLEKDENTKTVDDAKAAQDAVAQALTVLKEYYSGVQLVQTTAGSSLKGKAPEIFEGSYSGQGSEAVVAMLEVVQADYAKLESTTAAQEAAAAKDFTQLTADMAILEVQQKKDSEHKTAQKSDKEQSAMSKKVDLRSAQKELEAAEQYYEQLQDSCSATGSTAQERAARRAEEIQSLKEAMELLETR